MSIVQFAPARAKKKIVGPHELDLVTHCFTEQKIDGSRYKIHSFGAEELNRCDSRRESVTNGLFVEKSDRVPHLMGINLPEHSMFDCEFVSTADMILAELPGKFWDKLMDRYHPHMVWLREKFDGAVPVYPHVATTIKIMGSDAPEAIRKQEEAGYMWAYCFDIMRYNRQNVTANAQIKRRNFLAKILGEVNPESGMVMMPAWYALTNSEKEELFYLFTDIKGEGLILKDPEVKYNHAKAWWKWKRDYPADVVLTGGYKMGSEGRTGKMLGKVGSLEIGVYKNGELYPVGWMSAIMDSEAGLDEITQAALNEQLEGRVAEVRHNGTQKSVKALLGYTLRHPRFRRWRDDEKNPEDCTSLALLEEARD